MAIRTFFSNRNMLWWASLPLRLILAGFLYVFVSLLFPGDTKERDEVVKVFLEENIVKRKLTLLASEDFGAEDLGDYSDPADDPSKGGKPLKQKSR